MIYCHLYRLESYLKLGQNITTDKAVDQQSAMFTVWPRATRGLDISPLHIWLRCS